MDFFPGRRLGPYEVVARLGAGGMGEVWRARDLRLDRDVAIKVLPAELADDAQFRIRFDREARAIAQLAHPNICSLYDVGENYLVMELLEGETLAKRIQRGALPPRDVARIGAQIADALEKAHRRSIVHRDLKPENVMLTRSGAKLLDFGLAASTDPLKALRRLTETGMVVGTIFYMSPEQAQGQTVDHRSDIFTLGSVLYEMVTGRAPFAGGTTAEVFAAIINGQPPAAVELNPEVPPALDHVIVRCLQKSPDDRWQSAHDIAEELRWIAEGGSSGGATRLQAVPKRMPWKRWIPWAIAAACATAAGVLALRPAQRVEVMPRLAATIEVGVPFHSFTVSPDGRQFLFINRGGGAPELWLRRLDSLKVEHLPGTGGVVTAQFSPDGKSIVFAARGQLWTLRIGDPVPKAICTARFNPGESPIWTVRGTIIFNDNNLGPLLEVPVTGGEARAITVLGDGEIGHRAPQATPDGELLFFQVRTAQDDDPRVGMYVQRIGERNKHFVIGGEVARYGLVGNDRFAFPSPIDGTRLLWCTFDRKTLRLGAEQLAVDLDQNIEALLVSDNGTLVMREPSSLRGLVSYTRAGVSRVLKAESMINPRFSPDGKRIAYSGSNRRVGVLDVSRETKQVLTTTIRSGRPVWTPDGRRIVMRGAVTGGDSGIFDLYVRNADGSGTDALVIRSPRYEVPSDVSPDGRHVLFSSVGEDRQSEVRMAPLRPNAESRRLTNGTSDELATFSPDGEWIAYASEDTGRAEVYVQRLDGRGTRVQVSGDGATEPRWSRDGRELFVLLESGHIAAAPVRRNGTELEIGALNPLFPVTVGTPPVYDVSPDGQQFVVNEIRVAKRVHIITNVLPKP